MLKEEEKNDSTQGTQDDTSRTENGVTIGRSSTIPTEHENTSLISSPSSNMGGLAKNINLTMENDEKTDDVGLIESQSSNSHSSSVASPVQVPRGSISQLSKSRENSLRSIKSKSKSIKKSIKYHSKTHKKGSFARLKNLETELSNDSNNKNSPNSDQCGPCSQRNMIAIIVCLVCAFVLFFVIAIALKTNSNNNNNHHGNSGDNNNNNNNSNANNNTNTNTNNNNVSNDSTIATIDEILDSIPTLIVVSLDGFRASYLTNETYRLIYNISTPNFDNFISNGVHINEMKPVFPSVTFANHYTLVTGLYPKYHGIVYNEFFDQVLNETFSYKDILSTEDTSGKWWIGEAIWNTIKQTKNTINLKSSVLTWPGSTANSGKYGFGNESGWPDYWRHYNGSWSYTDRINTALKYLNPNGNITGIKDNKHYKLIMLYFESPDSQGHEYGPNSIEVADAIMNVDYYIGELINGINELGMENKTNIIIVADHGMTQLSNDKLIYVNTSIFDYTPWDIKNGVKTMIKPPILQFYTLNKNEMNSSELIKLFNKSIMYENDFNYFNIYDTNSINSNDLNSALHREYYYDNFGNGPFIDHNRVGDVIIEPKLGYSFYFNGIDESIQSWLSSKGNHGFNNSETDMQALFLAKGVSFREGYIKDKCNNVDLYQLFCYLLSSQEYKNYTIVPSPNNGSFENIKDVLIDFALTQEL